MAQAPLDDEPTIGKLVIDAQRDISHLVKQEVELAKSELKVSVKHGGVGIGLFGAAAFLLILAVIILSVAFAYLIHWNGDGLSLHWAFLIVFVFYVLIAALLVLIGVKQVKKVSGPDRAIYQAQEAKEVLTSSAKQETPKG